MNKTIKIIRELKTALKTALTEGNYSVSAEVEQGFLFLLNNALLGTELEAYINDINCIINQYMAIADAFDVAIKSKGENNVR